MAVPVKFRELGDFHLYYSGVEKAPYVTIFVGGNHEASNHLFELYYGGWVAPNIYYMGAANVLRLGALRIAGLSGIWKGYNYRKPHYERLPYNGDDVRSIYHVREFDTRKLLQLSSQIDVGISHDWPSGVEWLGDYKWLFRKKDLFEADARNGKLGSIAAKLVLQRLRPPYWFSAHLHIKYAAVIDHNKPWPENAPLEEHKPAKLTTTQNGIDNNSAMAGEDIGVNSIAEAPAYNADEIDLDIDDKSPTVNANPPSTQSVSASAEIELDLSDENAEGAPNSQPPHTSTIPEDIRAQLPAAFAKPLPPTQEPDPPTTIANTATRFLALDKCLPRRDFLQLLEIPAADSTQSQHSTPQTFQLSYDPEWLAITRVFAADVPILSSSSDSVPRDLGRPHYARLIAAELDWVETNIVLKNKLIVPHNFVQTAEQHAVMPDMQPTLPHPHEMPREHNNPQTHEFCALLQIPNPVAASEEETMARIQKGPRPNEERRDGGHRGGRGGGFGGGRGGRGGGGRGRGGLGRGGRGRGRGRGSW